MKKKLDFASGPLDKILSVFQKNRANVRIVGGAVRDKILGLNSSDIDLATSLLPEEVTKIFKAENIKVIPTGIEFGTVTIVIGGSNFEITTLRKDISGDGRHAIVEYTDNYQIDASRRDFTINALSYDAIEEKIYDYFGGSEDLKNRLVKFIGEPNERIKEDYLRILRFFRFSAYYSTNLNLEGLEACKANITGLAKISKERIHSEFCKILSCDKNIDFCIKAIDKISLFNIIVPNYKLNFSYILDFESKIFLFKEYKIDIKALRLALLIFPLGKKEGLNFMKMLKFSNNEIQTNYIICEYIFAIERIEDKPEIIFQICKGWYYHNSYIKLFLIIAYILGKITEDEMRANIKAMETIAPKIPIKSEELMGLGYEGLALGIRIKFLEKEWIKSGFSAEKEVLMSLK